MALDSSFSIESMGAPATSPVNAISATAVTRNFPIYERLAQELSVVAAQLIEAACKARGGDFDASRTYIMHAIALLNGMPRLGPRGAVKLSNAETNVIRGGLPAWQMRKIIAHVETNLSRRISVKELASLLRLSASHFCRAFKSAFGAPPRDYVIRRRIEMAQAMMLTTSEPIRSIALSCGMCDQQHFTRSFRRLVGETPSMWRRTRRGSLQLD
jgi:AraC family transcriptional regulator